VAGHDPHHVVHEYRYEPAHDWLQQLHAQLTLTEGQPELSSLKGNLLISILLGVMCVCVGGEGWGIQNQGVWIGGELNVRDCG
jgi:hypothetical protein